MQREPITSEPTLPSARPATSRTVLPMTIRARRTVEQRLREVILESERLAQDVLADPGDTIDGGRGPSRLDVLEAQRRLLEQTLRSAEVVLPTDSAVIGAVVELADPDGRVEVVELTYPGDPDPDKATPASPIGSALLGCRVGQRIDIVAPAGRVRRTVVGVHAR